MLQLTPNTYVSTYSPLQAPPWQCGLQVHTLHPLQDGCRRWDAHSAVGTAHGVGGAHTGQLLAVPTPPTAAPIPLLTAAKQPGFFYASFQADTFFLKSSSYFLILPMIVSGKFWHCYLALSITRFLPERLQAFYSPTRFMFTVLHYHCCYLGHVAQRACPVAHAGSPRAEEGGEPHFPATGVRHRVSAHLYLSCLHPSSASTPLTVISNFFSLM